MGRVGDELPPPRLGAFQSCGQLVEGPAQALDLVVPADGRLLGIVALAHAADLIQNGAHAPRECGREEQGEQHDAALQRKRNAQNVALQRGDQLALIRVVRHEIHGPQRFAAAYERNGGVAFYGAVGIAGEKDVAALQRRDKLRKQQRLSLGVAGGQGIVYGNARSVGHDGAGGVQLLHGIYGLGGPACGKLVELQQGIAQELCFALERIGLRVERHAADGRRGIEIQQEQGGRRDEDVGGGIAELRAGRQKAAVFTL